MSEQFRQAAIELLLAKGMPTAKDSWYWGWQDYDGEHYKGKCPWSVGPESDLKEVSYYEFDGTDHDSSHQTLLVVTHVSCSCGKYKDVEIGIQGTTGELLSELIGPVQRESK